MVPTVKTWEYYIKLAPRRVGTGPVLRMLEFMDERGWEFVSHGEGVYVFRRPVQP